MQAEKTQRASFFDDDDLNITFNFAKPEKAHQKDLQQPHIVRDSLIKQVSGSTSKQEGYYAIHGKTLACYKTATSKAADTVLDLSFSKLKVIIPADDHSNFGFQLAKNDISYDFYSTEKQVIEDWVEVLKDLCVLKTFHDDYKALKMIGRGSFAKVYLVESKANGKMYAVKAFTKEGIVLSNKNNAKPSMLNEIDIMRALDHENVIKLYEVHETENSIYLVLELIQGKSLQDTLKKPTFKDEFSDVKVLNMIRSILDALDYLASKDIMHRDLKPDNILLDKESKIKIADFGLATLVDLPEYIFKKCGTPGYIAPEVFKYDQKVPSTNYDHKCDVFSAGCIFFYMLFGFPFFESTDASEILRLNRKFTGDFDGILVVKQELKNSNSKIPRDALDLLLKLLELDAKKRISAGEALCHPYFIPVPKGMSKMAGSNDLISTPVGSPAKNSSKNGGFEYAMMKGMDSPRSPATPAKDNNKERFAKKNSFYLDMGKPELNGKIDTITVGSSNNNSVLLRKDSSNSVGSNTGCESPSAFSRTPKHESQVQSNFKRSRSLKTNNPMASTGQSFLKAAIFRNMQKNNTEAPGEEGKEESLKVERRHSDNPSGRNHSVSSNSRSPDRESQEDDNSPGLADKSRTPGRTPQSSKKRFQPFAQKTSVKNAK